jgi:uncharacterized YccA/Bax inhibitor family protein
MMEKSRVFGRNESLALNSRTFQRVRGRKLNSAMTIRGAVTKTAILLTIVAISASGGWLLIRQDGLAGVVLVMLAFPGALLVGTITCLKMEAAPITAPIYAFLEGSLLGFISGMFEEEYPGIVINAVFLTFGTLLGLLIIYHLSHYQVTARFRAGVISGTSAILLLYMVEIILQLLGFTGIQFLHLGGIIGIGFSLFVVFVAALNLVLDFDLIESGARSLAPKYMEWYCAFGLMVTLIWLYLEILRLLAILASSRDDN